MAEFGDFEEFWIVWSPTGCTPPSWRHESEDSARVEAGRLAKLRPRAEFYVLKAIGKATTPDVVLWSDAVSSEQLAAVTPEGPPPEPEPEPATALEITTLIDVAAAPQSTPDDENEIPF